MAVMTGSRVEVSTASSVTVGRFDFAYSISGDARLRPVQVFDDGIGKTYFQFRPGNSIPAVFAAAGKEMLLFSPEGPYQVVSSRARDFVLAMGLARGRVVHADVLSGAVSAAQPPSDSAAPPTTGALAPEPARYEASNPTHSSYATPLRGDVIQWVDPGVQEQQAIFFAHRSATLDRRTEALLTRLALRIGPQAKVQLIVRSDGDPTQHLGDTRALVLRASLIRNGIPAAHITVQPVHETGGLPAREFKVGNGRKPVRLPSYIRWSSMASSAQAPGKALAIAGAPTPAGQASPGHFVMYRSDAHVEATLRRWGRAAGYQVLWDAPMTPVTADSSFHTPDFLDALDQLLRGLQATGYPLKRIMPSDRVVRIVHAH